MPDLFATKVAVYGPLLMDDFGLTDVQAAAVFGNAGHESAGFATLQEIKPTVPGSRGGWGWFQLTGPRRVTFEAYCKRNALDPASDKANYAFLFLELKGSESPALLALRKAKTLEEATDVFCRTFERPGVVALASRMKWAQRALIAVRTGLAARTANPAPPAPAAPAPAPAAAPAVGGAPPIPAPAPPAAPAGSPPPAPAAPAAPDAPGAFARAAERLRTAYPMKKG